MSVGSHVLVKNKVIKYLQPRCVVGQIVIVLRGDLANLRQATEGYVGEVVVLDVIANVED
jgi:hypothetical protein